MGNSEIVNYFSESNNYFMHFNKKNSHININRTINYREAHDYVCKIIHNEKEYNIKLNFIDGISNYYGEESCESLKVIIKNFHIGTLHVDYEGCVTFSILNKFLPNKNIFDNIDKSLCCGSNLSAEFCLHNNELTKVKTRAGNTEIFRLIESVQFNFKIG